jgi:hypothetical protein
MMTFLKRNILLFCLFLVSLTGFSQPPNDSCAHAPMINIVNGVGFFSGSTAGATPSPSGMWISSCDTTPNLKDVFWTFNSGNSTNYQITINTGCSGITPHLEVFRILTVPAACTTPGTAFPANIYCPLYSSQTASITLTGLTANADYYIRVGAKSGIPIAVNGNIMALNNGNIFNAGIHLDSTTTENVDTNTTGRLWNNDSPAVSDYYYTIAPNKSHDAIRVEIQKHDFDTLASNARIEFYLGDSLNVDSLIETVDYLTASPYYTDIHTKGAVTVRYVSSPNIQISEFQLTWHIPDYAPSLFPDITICEGEDYNGYTMSGFYVDTVKAVTGCDSIGRFHLSILPSSRDTFNVSICQGDNYNGLTNSGFYADTLTASNGCDSLQFINLVVNNIATPTISMVNDSTLTSSLAVNYQWFFNTTPSYSDTLQTISATQTGIYSVLATDINGCLAADTFHFIMVNIEKIANDQPLLDIVPNPNQGSFNLVIKDLPEGKWQLNIYSISGQLIQTETQNIYQSTGKIPVELGNVNEGIYLLKLENKERIVVTRKFIVN